MAANPRPGSILVKPIPSELRILHVIPSLSPLLGGPSSAILPMVAALRASGVEAEIATTNGDGPGELDVPLGELTDYQGVATRFFPRCKAPLPGIRSFHYSRSLTAWLKEHIREYSALHVHMIFLFPSTAAMRIARAAGVPYLVRPVGMLDKWSLRQKAFKKKCYLGLVEGRNLEAATAFQVMSPQEKHELERLDLPGKLVEIPHGISPPALIPDAHGILRRKLGLEEREKIILFMSRFHPKKGLDLLIPALGKLRDSPFTLVLAGGGAPAYQGEIKRLLDDAVIAGRTVFPGFLRGGEKDLFLQGADLFALTSYDENFGISVLEALASGLPVLVTREVALSAFVESQNLGLTAATTAEAVRAALASALDKGASRWDRKERGRIREVTLAKFQWEQVATQLAATYRDIISQSKSRFMNPSKPLH